MRARRRRGYDSLSKGVAVCRLQNLILLLLFAGPVNAAAALALDMNRAHASKGRLRQRPIEPGIAPSGRRLNYLNFVDNSNGGGNLLAVGHISGISFDSGNSFELTDGSSLPAARS